MWRQSWNRGLIHSLNTFLSFNQALDSYVKQLRLKFRISWQSSQVPARQAFLAALCPGREDIPSQNIFRSSGTSRTQVKVKCLFWPALNPSSGISYTLPLLWACLEFCFLFCLRSLRNDSTPNPLLISTPYYVTRIKFDQQIIRDFTIKVNLCTEFYSLDNTSCQVKGQMKVTPLNRTLRLTNFTKFTAKLPFCDVSVLVHTWRLLNALWGFFGFATATARRDQSWKRVLRHG